MCLPLLAWLDQWALAGYPAGYALACAAIHSAFSASAFSSTWYLSLTMFYSERGNGTLLELGALSLSACAALLSHYIVDAWGAF
jgi:hypothetical protein